MVDVGALTKEHFAPHVGEEFRLRTDTGIVALTLRSVDGTGRRWDADGREAFSILFGGPREAMLPQAIYRLEHDSLDQLDIFLVPVGPDEAGQRYEAVFT